MSSPITRFALGYCLVAGLSVPASAQEALDRLQREVEVQRGEPRQPPPEFEPGYLGLIADDREEEGSGVRVLEILKDGPADSGGLVEGDLIVGIDGRRVHTMDDLERSLVDAPVGTQMQFEVERQARRKELTVILGARPPAGERRFADFGRIPQDSDQGPGAQLGPAGPPPYLGVLLAPLTDDARRRLAIQSPHGALVSSLERGSPAAEAGLEVGSVVTVIDGLAIERPEDVDRALAAAQAGDVVSLSFERDGRSFDAQIALAAAPQPLAGNESQRLEALESRIAELELRLAELEALLADALRNAPQAPCSARP